MTTVAVRFRLDPETLDLVDEHAKRERRSRAKLVRMIVEDWLMDRAAEEHEGDMLPRIPNRQTVDEFIAGKVEASS